MTATNRSARAFGDAATAIGSSWPAWLVLVASCAVALGQRSIDDRAVALGALLSLALGALLGRLLRLDQLFRRTSAWMWAVAVSSVALALLRVGLSPVVATAAGVFFLPLDWRNAVRARAAIAAGFVFLVLSTRDGGGLSLAGAALWGSLALLGLVLLERDIRRAAASRIVPASTATAPVAWSRSPWPRQSWRDGIALAAVVIATVIIALVFLPPPTPAPSTGRTGQGGEGDATYWGFGNRLDTAVRGRRSEDVVLRVNADAPALWRGDSFDEFDGRVWTRSSTGVRPLGGRDPVIVPSDAFSDQRGVDTVDETQVFTFEQGGNDLVFGSGRPRSVRTPGDFLSWTPGAGTIRLDAPLGRGGSYTVVSARPVVDDARLRAADPRALMVGADLNGPDRARLQGFLTVPPTTSERTRALAASVTAGATSVYDEVQALQAWLGSNTTYTLDVPPLPDGADAVDHYLFEDRQGFCEQIASALTVMLRTLGVPARLAVGFVPDHQDTATGEWIVKEKDAHAWVEVWWPGLGWQGFDPTASVPLAPESSSSPTSRASALGPAIALAIGLVVLAALGGWLLPRLLARRARRARPWAEQAVDRLVRAGARAGRPRAPTETLLEYGAALERSSVAGRGGGPVSETLSAELFGGPEGGTAVLDRDAAETALTSLEQAARRQRRSRRRRHPANRLISPAGNEGDTGPRPRPG